MRPPKPLDAKESTTFMDAENTTETIRKIYVRDLREKEPVHTVFKVTKKARQSGRSGRSYIVATLGDRTGEVDARIFDNVDALDASFVEGDFVLVKGNVISWQKRLQVVIESLERLDPEPIDQKEFEIPPAPVKPAEPQAEAGTKPAERPAAGDKAERPERVEGGRAVAQIRELVGRVHDNHVRALLSAILDEDDIARGLSSAPAAKGVHHAYKGGLAEHILSVMKLAHRIADHYPMADRDLLIAGALLHDIYKVKEIVPDKGGGFEYSDEGRLVGHLVMAAQKIHEKASAISGFPTALEHHLTHLVLAHHGQLEWGSPKEPMTLEALLVHLIDTVDSRVASWLEIMERDPGERWTDSKNLYGRHLWKAAPPTARGKSPIEGRPSRRGKRRGGGGGERDRDRGHDKKPRQEQGAPGVPTFKPLEQMTQNKAEPERPADEQTPSAE